MHQPDVPPHATELSTSAVAQEVELDGDTDDEFGLTSAVRGMALNVIVRLSNVSVLFRKEAGGVILSALKCDEIESLPCDENWKRTWLVCLASYSSDYCLASDI